MHFCWGDNSFGQLGVKAARRGKAGQVRCQPGASLGSRDLLQAACGERHSLLLLSDGTVWSCGSNDCGQLGRKNTRNCEWPAPIQALKTQEVVLVSCGKEHSLAVCKTGRVFSWGSGSEGQLGIKEFKKQNFIPKEILDLSSVKIIQVSCGLYHSIALAQDGKVFSWGKNHYGQLGLKENVSLQTRPQWVKSLNGIPMAQVAAGGDHSFALSLSGTPYGWGRNNVGQLALSGKNAPEQIHKPCSIDELKSLHVTYISCGDEHTAVLTQDGKVFTFGSNNSGQLGRRQVSKKRGPQTVDSAHVFSQIACGSHHTLAYAYTTGQVVSFGCGSQSHLNSLLQPGSLEQNFSISNLISLSDYMLKVLPWDSPHQEALSIFLLLPECPLMHKPENWESLVVPFAKAVCEINDQSSEVLEKCWESLEESSFNSLIQMLKRSICLQMDCQPGRVKNHCNSKALLGMLKKLHRVSEISIIGESYPECGGVRKEFFHCVFKEMIQPEYEMFVYSENSSLMWFPTNPKFNKKRYFLFGVLYGLSIASFNVANLPFPLALYKKLLDQKPSLEDLQELSPELDVDLIPNGSSILVDKTNKEDFVSRCINYIFNTSVKKIYKEFQTGFYKVCTKEILNLFHPEELKVVTTGNPDYDWKVFEENSKYFKGYDKSHPTIVMFWEAFHRLSLEKKKDFLLFLTGSDRLQAQDIQNRGINFIHPESAREDELPIVHTCFHNLYLPPYSTMERVEEVLQIAINNNRGFAL
uniref:HECT and RLD domain containing E3 ubiquitin protein ligase family member 6 n=1 Tax=Vombatus ursinus TaxID=29139 RepID=A0A4X2M1G2_VOMUR